MVSAAETVYTFLHLWGILQNLRISAIPWFWSAINLPILYVTLCYSLIIDKCDN